jgi:ABC-type glycerol-3-phosphate transport system substrate-binding protein
MFDDWHSTVTRLGRICAIVCHLVISLSGCGLATPAPEPATIAFVHPTSDTDYYQQLLQAFNESYPSITVELRPRTWDELDHLGARDADVLVATAFDLSELQDQGHILSLDPFIEQGASFDPSDFYPGTAGLFTTQGKTWGVPAGVDPIVMFYNQDLLDQYDAPYPGIGWTWEDFLNVALAVRDPEAGVFGYVSTQQSYDAMLFIYQHGGRIFDSLQDPTRTTFDDPLTIEALEWFAALIHEYDVVPTPEQSRQAFGGDRRYSNYRGISRGQVGMWIGRLSERGGQNYWPAEWVMNWGMAPLPRDAQSVTGAWVEGYFISSQTEHPEACWQWITFLTQQTPTRLMPARKSLAESTAYEQQVGGDVAAFARASMESAALISPELVEFEEALQVFDLAVGKIVKGDSTPREAMSEAQRQSELRTQP